MKSRWLKKAMAAFLAVLMTVCAVPVAAFVPETVETGEEFDGAENALPYYYVSDGNLYVQIENETQQIYPEYSFEYIYSGYEYVFAHGKNENGEIYDIVLGFMDCVDFDSKAENANLYTVTGSANETAIYNYAVNTMGLNTAAACGILANIQKESGFNPHALGDSGTSYGICQWHNSRWDRLKAYCTSNNLDSTTIEGQLRYLEYELKNYYSSVWNRLKSVENTAEGAYDAAAYWCAVFEVPAGYGYWSNGEIHYGKTSIARGNLAKSTYWNEYSSNSSSLMSTPPTVTEAEVIVKINDLVSKLDGKYFTINQQACVPDAEDKATGWHGSCVGSPSNCKNSDVIQAQWFKNMFGSVSVSNFPGIGTTPTAWTCAGFANFAEWYIFKSANSDVVTVNKVCENVAITTETLNQYCKPGDGVRITASGGRAHSFIYINNNSYLDCNGWDAGLTKPSIVERRNASISQRFSAWKMTVYRATNYDTSTSAYDGYLYTQYNDPDGVHSINAQAAVGNEVGTIPTEDGSGCGYVVVTQYSSDGKWGYVNYKGIVGWTRLYEPYIKLVSAYTCPVVTFNANGGSVGTASKKVYINTPYGTLPTPTCTGYSFAGWYTAASGGSLVKEDTNVSITSNQTLYAHWTPYTYTVSYNANGGTGAPGNQTKTHGQSLTLSSVKPTKDGYTFQGWSTSSTGSVQYNPGSAYTGNANLTLYAVWSIKTYTISYNANGGTGAPGNQTKTHGQSLTLSSVKPTKDGYTFQGWSTTLNGSVQYNPGSAYTVNDHVTLYAVWNPVKYPIYFNANGGTGAPDTQYQTHFEYLTLSSVVPKKDGYTFKGWSTTLNGTVAYQPGGQFGENRSVTLYAVWAVIPVTSITLNQTSASLKKGETLTLTATVAPSDAANKSVTWSSGNTSVATVSTSGVVTAVGEGTAVITVKTADGGKTASCTVAVAHTHNYTGTYYETAHPHKAYSKCSCGEISYTGATQKVASCASCYPVTGVTLDKTTATLKKGETLALAVTVSPSDAGNKAFTVTSSNPSVMSAKYGIGVCVGDLFDGSACTASHCEFTALSAGSTTLTFTTEDGQKTATCTVTVTEPVVNAKAKFTLSETSGRPGDTVKITLSLKTEETVNSIAISGITYDKSIMTFTGFSDYEHIEDLTILPPTFDEEKMAIVIGLKNAAAFDGDICTLNFKINENALEGVTNIDASSVVKLKSTEIPSAVASGKVNIRLQTLGDIDGNDTVDIDDAVLLFQYSMLPELYPISYAGNLDFNKDGTVDIDDAVRLFQYSMLPDLYPLE